MPTNEAFRLDLIRWLTCMDSNGVWSDRDSKCEALAIATPEAVLPIVIRWACDEVTGDIGTGLVPPTVQSFAELHNYVDANKYGGAFFWPQLTGDSDDPS